MSDLVEVVMLRSLDGRLWKTQKEYDNYLTFEATKHKIKDMALEFKNLCLAAEKMEDGPARAFIAWCKRNKDIIVIW